MNRHAIAALLTTCALLAGCAPSAGMAPSPIAANGALPAEGAVQVIAGTARLGLPVAGATVTLRDLKGQVVGGPAKTSAMGGFAVAVQGQVSDLEVVVEGGTQGKAPFKGTLRAAVRGLGPGNDEVAVGLTSTLAAAYLTTHPAATPDQAWDAMAAFLGHRPGATRSHMERHLDLAKLEDEAERDGGLAAHVAGLGTSYAAGEPARYKLASLVEQPPARPAEVVAGRPATADLSAEQILADAARLTHALDGLEATYAEMCRDEAASLRRASYRDPLLDDGKTSLLSALRSDIRGALDLLAVVAALGPAANADPFDPVNLKTQELANALSALQLQGPSRWRAALDGDDASLARWSHGIATAEMLYTPARAEKIEDWWALVDGYQATDAYLRRYLAQRSKAEAKAPLLAWVTARTATLGKLRGTVRASDVLDVSAITGVANDVRTTPLAALPPNRVASVWDSVYFSTEPAESTGLGGEWRYNPDAATSFAIRRGDGWGLPTHSQVLALVMGATDVVAHLKDLGFPTNPDQGVLTGTASIDQVRAAIAANPTYWCEIYSETSAWCFGNGYLNLDPLGDGSLHVAFRDDQWTTTNKLKASNDVRPLFIYLTKPIDVQLWY